MDLLLSGELCHAKREEGQLKISVKCFIFISKWSPVYYLTTFFLLKHNFSLAMKLLKELHRESKARDDWQMQWVQSYCRLSHSRSQGQTCPEQILTALKTVSLLGTGLLFSIEISSVALFYIMSLCLLKLILMLYLTFGN